MNSKHMPESTLRMQSKNDILRSQTAAFAITRNGGANYTESAAITSTTALVSIVLTAFTLFALYTGLQNNVTVVTSQQQSLRVQIQLCLLLPLAILYFTKVALEDYMRTFFSFNLSTSKTSKIAQD